MSAWRECVAVLLRPLRHRGRRVAWTPAFMGLGNLLQLAMWAHVGTRSGSPRWIRSTPKLDPWLEVFPGLRQVVLLPDEVRFTDRRVAPWSQRARDSGTDGAVSPHEPVDIPAVEEFLRDVVLPGSTIVNCADRNVLVVNVRRGDYYSDADIRQQYGFDVLSYLKVAVGCSVEHDGSPTSITVVSDDVDWCRRELAWLGDIAPSHFPVSAGPVQDFAAVCSARRMVITNSTFSYWAAHVSNAVHGTNHGQIWAPRFFDRSQNDGRSWLLDERWSVIEELPGGWDESTVQLKRSAGARDGAADG